MEISALSLGISTERAIAKFNHNHGHDGRFTTGSGGAAAITASRVYDRASKAEPGITSTMQDVASRHGMKMEGLAFRLKQKSSLARKIEADASAAGITADQAGEQISDAVRYTMVTDEGSYAKMSQSVLSEFSAKGYKIRQKNYWKPGDPYQGINVAMTHPSGQKLELQFHTAKSLAVKESIHKDYEAYRVSTDVGERRLLWSRMVKQAESIPVPSGVLDIPELRQQTFQTP